MRMQVWSLTSLSGSGIWHCRELCCRSQTQLGSHVAVAVVWPSSCSSDSAPSLGTSICHGCIPKKQKQNNYNSPPKKNNKNPWEIIGIGTNWTQGTIQQPDIKDRNQVVLRSTRVCGLCLQHCSKLASLLPVFSLPFQTLTWQYLTRSAWINIGPCQGCRTAESSSLSLGLGCSFSQMPAGLAVAHSLELNLCQGLALGWRYLIPAASDGWCRTSLKDHSSFRAKAFSWLCHSSIFSLPSPPSLTFLQVLIPKIPPATNIWLRSVSQEPTLLKSNPVALVEALL